MTKNSIHCVTGWLTQTKGVKGQAPAAAAAGSAESFTETFQMSPVESLTRNADRHTHAL